MPGAERSSFLIIEAFNYLIDKGWWRRYCSKQVRLIWAVRVAVWLYSTKGSIDFELNKLVKEGFFIFVKNLILNIKVEIGNNIERSYFKKRFLKSTENLVSRELK